MKKMKKTFEGNLESTLEKPFFNSSEPLKYFARNVGSLSNVSKLIYIDKTWRKLKKVNRTPKIKILVL